MTRLFTGRLCHWFADRFNSSAARGPASRSHRGPELLLVVEGRHDIEFLKRISVLLAADQPALPCLGQLEQAGRLVFVPAGGGDFQPWLARLAPFGCAEFHILDREVPPATQQRLAWAELVNRRPRCRAFVTGWRSLENYLHPAAIEAARGLRIAFSRFDDVADLAARADHTLRYGAAAWQALSRRGRRRLRDRAKRWLNTTAVEPMTSTHLAESDPRGDIRRWFTVIAKLLDSQ